ncbi:MAG: helix-turn-helix domain-containing protein [Erysipelotrichaceae bacterium]|nr:helix-turn-helix domain-containing protein [Erysipelotrichaceae bacterium]
MNYNLANVLRNERMKLNISQSELARRVGVDRTTILKIENGERQKPTIDTLIRLSKGLNINLSLLLELSGYASRNILDDRIDEDDDIEDEFITQYTVTIKGEIVTNDNNKEDAFKNIIKLITETFNSVDGLSEDFDELLDNSNIFLSLKSKEKI